MTVPDQKEIVSEMAVAREMLDDAEDDLSEQRHRSAFRGRITRSFMRPGQRCGLKVLLLRRIRDLFRNLGRIW